MHSDQWEKVDELFHAALAQPVEGRISFLDRACAGDEQLRLEVESLLAADAHPTIDMTQAAKNEAVNWATRNKPIGKQLGHYRILSQLGQGGMGEVYLAEDSQLGRKVAVKLLPAIIAHNPLSLRRFQLEARAAAALNHPNIATIYSVEEVEGQHFITMEYVEGQTLDNLIPAAGMALENFYRWMPPLADALAHAHEKGVIHRDLKPANIMVTNAGIPKILDFGLARVEPPAVTNAATQSALTMEGQVLGTPSYMSPEQAEGRSVDPRTDIFSFGIVLYEALTGGRPFQGENYAVIVSELLRSEPPTVSSLRPDTPFLLARLIRRCLRKDRQLRCQSMQEVHTFLDEIRAEAEAKDNGSLGAAVPVGKLRLGSRSLVWGVGAMALLLMGVLAWNLARFIPADPAPNVRFAIDLPGGNMAEIAWAQLSPDGRAIVYSTVADGDAGGLYLRAIDQFEANPIAGVVNARRPFFSHDGKWIAYFLNNELKKIPVIGGTALTICNDCLFGADAYWGKDEHIIVGSEKGLYRVSAAGGKPQMLTTPDQAQGELTHWSPQLLPDEIHILFTVETTKGLRAEILNLADGKRHTLEAAGDAAMAQYVKTGHLLFGRSGQLMAVPFDPAALKIVGTPVPVVPGLFNLYNFSVADNGTLLYVPANASRENSLLLVDRKGQPRTITERRADYRSPQFSPDGNRVAVKAGDDIWIYEVSGGRGLRLTYTGDNQTPIWSPDGSEIVYISHRNGSWKVFRKAVAGSGEEIELLHSDFRLQVYSWHPSAQLLALSQFNANTSADIILLSLVDRQTTAFLSSTFIEDTPRFSSDGRWLAYYTNESGKVEIQVQAWPGPGPKLVASRGGGLMPVWSRNGRELFYHWRGRIYVVPVLGGAEISFGAPRVLFEGKYQTGFDAAPDAQAFVAVRDEQGVLPRRVHLVLNWTEELKWLTSTSQPRH